MIGNKYTYTFFWVLLVISVIFFHSWRLSTLPGGLYVDETSIGYNAALIATSGQDEHGIAWPIYFKAYGEYKNPLYIYGTAFIFKLFGASEFTLRFTSALFFFWFIAALAALTQRLFRNAHITFFAVLSAGFMPYFFPLSRIAFEAISQLATTATWLLLLHCAYYKPVKNIHPLYMSFAAGLLLGVSVYSYSTSRLLAFIFMAGWTLFFTSKKTWRLTAVGLFGFSIALIPYGMFSLYNPGALSSRFYIVTYIHDTTLSLQDKIVKFSENYVQYFSPPFLLFDGDTNLRHSSGYGGAVFASSLVLVVFGCAEIVRQFLRDRFALFIIFIALTSPIAAALTTGDAGHTLRSLPLAIAILLLTSYGLHFIYTSFHWRYLYAALLILTIWQSATYLNHYFTKYPLYSAPWMEMEGFYPALKEAVNTSPRNIIISSTLHQAETSVRFYEFMLPGLQGATIRFQEPLAQHGSCVLYNEANPIIDTISPQQPVEIIDDSKIKIRCFPKE